METRSYAFLFAALAIGGAHAQTITRSNTADNLNLGTAWVLGTAPTGAQIATWDAASTLTNTLGGNLTWGGINLEQIDCWRRAALQRYARNLCQG